MTNTNAAPINRLQVLPRSKKKKIILSFFQLHLHLPFNFQDFYVVHKYEICDITDDAKLEISKHEKDEDIKAHTINVKNDSYEESGDDLYKSVFSNEDDLSDLI